MVWTMSVNNRLASKHKLAKSEKPYSPYVKFLWMGGHADVQFVNVVNEENLLALIRAFNWHDAVLIDGDGTSEIPNTHTELYGDLVVIYTDVAGKEKQFKMSKGTKIIKPIKPIKPKKK